MMQGHAWIFQILTGFAILFLIYYYYRSPEGSLVFTLAIAAILGGALGNFTDRFYGATPGVVDFIDVRFGQFRWFIFNVADAFICVGAFLLAIAFYKFEKAEKLAAAAAAEEAAKTKYPVVLAHGMAGWDSIIGIDYFGDEWGTFALDGCSFLEINGCNDWVPGDQKAGAK